MKLLFANGFWVLLCTLVFFWLAPSVAKPNAANGESADSKSKCTAPVAAEAENPPRIIGESSSTQGVRDLIKRVAPTDLMVLILGESGTGKELVASEIHRQSRRKDEPYVVVNTAAITASLMESELFGHEAGAFTGAEGKKEGYFERADGGTLFLDEFGELPVESQAKLLRVFDGHPFHRVGGTTDIHVDVRIILATNRNMDKEIADGNMREDIFYRIGGFPIELAPLRKRRKDILPIARHLLELDSPKHCTALGRSLITGFTPEAEKKISEGTWAGNVRELRHAIERAVIATPVEEVLIPDTAIRESTVGLLSPDEQELGPVGRAGHAIDQAMASGELPSWEDAHDQLMRTYLERVFARNNENVSATARDLNMQRSTLVRYLRKYGLK